MDECARLVEGSGAELGLSVLGVVPSITEHLKKVSGVWRLPRNTYLQCEKNWYIICTT
jgi:hypothetical protein